MRLARSGKRFVLAVSAAAIAALACACVVEAWTRGRWNDRKGRPGFFLAHPTRLQRLAPGYTGWFAGVPVHINQLGFRADREYDLHKSANTFRILVLGDSVTFGHGSMYEHTYPVLAEQHLREWRPDIDWQVWNAAVPGYNTSQELAQLLEIGPSVRPDLVIVGFFENDIVDNFPIAAPGAWARVRSALLSWSYRHVYSIELYKRVYLQIAWMLSKDTGYRQRLDHLGAEQEMLANVSRAEDMAAQRLTSYDRLPGAAAADCPGEPGVPPDVIASMQHEKGWDDWLAAVRRFQQLHRSGGYSVAFFANIAPLSCRATDTFFDGGSSTINRFLMQLFSEGTPAVSTYDAFLHLRPSQMPEAKGHSLGNANAVKAGVLFRFLRDRVLATLPTAGARPLTLPQQSRSDRR